MGEHKRNGLTILQNAFQVGFEIYVCIKNKKRIKEAKTKNSLFSNIEWI